MLTFLTKARDSFTEAYRKRHDEADFAMIFIGAAIPFLFVFWTCVVVVTLNPSLTYIDAFLTWPAVIIGIVLLVTGWILGLEPLAKDFRG